MDELCPVCENKANLYSMDMTVQDIEELASMEEISDYCGDEILKKRLEICDGCTNLVGKMTCSLCGCFVRLRARHITSHCVLSKW